MVCTSVLFLGACGGSGSDSTPPVIEAPPSSNSVTVNISTNQAKVFLGNSTEISWSSTNDPVKHLAVGQEIKQLAVLKPWP